jgi:hypothetical protein
MEVSAAPQTPDELVKTVADPVDRIAVITEMARRQNWLPPQWAAQRHLDIAAALAAGHPKSYIIRACGLSPQRVHQLLQKTLRG